MVSYSIVAKVLCPNGCTFVHISVRTGNICIQCTIIILYNRYLVRKIVRVICIVYLQVICNNIVIVKSMVAVV